MSALESIIFACKNVGTCEISEASCTHKSKKHAGEKRSGGLGKILKFFKGNLGMSAFCSCILSYNFLTFFELSRLGQGLTI